MNLSLFATSMFVRKLPALVVLLASLQVGGAQAHLMAAQQGTFNVVGDAAFVVLSVPSSAFAGTDSNRDGKLSAEELQQHRQVIVATIKQRFFLKDKRGSRALDGLMLSLAEAHDNAESPSAQLNVLGRFSLAYLEGAVSLYLDLPGSHQGEKQLSLTAKKRAIGLEQSLVFSAEAPSQLLAEALLN